jgi:hypothetical protein
MHAWQASAISLTLSVAGCLPIPHRHLRQPAVTFSVRDTAGRPVVWAQVSLYAAIVVGEGVRSVSRVHADARGIAHFPRLKEWHALVLLVPDGEAPWRWAWCATAPSHVSATGRLESEAADTVQVVLAASAVPGRCPVSPQALRDVGRK